jgi:hypothetical protein
VARVAVGALDSVSGTVASVEDIDDVTNEGNAARIATAIVWEDTVNCPNGGTAHYAVDFDLENLFQGPSVGDSSSFDFNACAQPDAEAAGEEVTMDGGIEYAVAQASGSLLSGTFDYTYVYTFDDFQVSETGGGLRTADGGFTVRVRGQSASQTNYTVSSSSLRVTEGGITRSLSAFQLDSTINISPDSFEVNAEGIVSSSEISGAVAFETTTPFTGTSEDPANGVMKITGVDDSSVTIVIEDSVVTLEIDSDGDGTADATISVTWAELEG